MYTHPLQTPLRIAFVNSFMCASTALTSGVTSLPSTKIGRFLRFRKAICNTDLFSVKFIFCPANIASRESSNLRARAKEKRSCKTS